jgi:hypothetical protein
MRRTWGVVVCAAVAAIAAAPSAQAAPLATATTEDATSVAQTSATLHGTLNTAGLPAEYAFQYGTSRTYDHETTVQVTTTGFPSDEPVSATITGLSPGTTYHFRLTALIGAVPTYPEVDGADDTFTTLSPGGRGGGPGHHAGSVTLLKKRLVVRGGKVRVPLKCGGTRTCAGVLSITSARAVGTVLKRVRCVSGKQFTIAAGSQRKVKATVRMPCLALLASSTHGRRGAFLKVSLSTGQPDFSTGVTLVLG